MLGGLPPESEQRQVEERRQAELAAWRAREEANKPENRRKVIRRKVLENQRKGIVCYDFDGWNWLNSPEGAPFEQELEPNSELVGEYEVYYHAHEKDFHGDFVFAMQRTTKRKLILTLQQDGRLEGTMSEISRELSAHDPQFDGFVCTWEDKSGFVENSSSSRTDKKSASFSLTESPDTTSIMIKQPNPVIPFSTKTGA